MHLPHVVVFREKLLLLLLPLYLRQVAVLCEKLLLRLLQPFVFSVHFEHACHSCNHSSHHGPVSTILRQQCCYHSPFLCRTARSGELMSPACSCMVAERVLVWQYSPWTPSMSHFFEPPCLQTRAPMLLRVVGQGRWLSDTSLPTIPWCLHNRSRRNGANPVVVCFLHFGAPLQTVGCVQECG